MPVLGIGGLFFRARDPGTLSAWCREHLAAYKLPRQIVFGELPKTATGKVQKYLLRERAKEA